MRDGKGREIDYARLSITDRCNLRCVYCMPEEGVEKLYSCDILSFEEILRVVRALVSLGIRKVKVTGGEPLVRRDAARLVRDIRALDGIECVTMTTNGILLPRYAEPLREAGLDGVNVSLDTLDPEAYRRITRWGDVADALAGIDAALAAGIPSVKVNCVPSSRNAEGIAAVAALARERDIQVRYIEMMPVGLGGAFIRVDNRRVREILEAAYGEMTPFDGKLGNGPAVYGSLPGFRGKIGFISAVGACFCGGCNRVRITADGAIKTCLHAGDGVSLRPALADGEEALAALLREAILAKPERHHFGEGCAGAESRIMSQIGG